ncbi:hypothetical protein PhCBS80983_g05776 [Powellomyces hirtus]|uniref:VPS9 domain-containing protein n=1 Tax=Powellomyces hirtus TaxID=109895 RepID=A0A507DTH2_9FUNG|nr:hypothetical protein PhCBS80983_g05776 [Powellomyces hirtus]
MVDYEQFLSQLRTKEAAPLMTHFKGFLVRFNSEKRPIMQHRKLVASFLHYIYSESLQNEVFASSTSDDELENIREGWEKLVMMNIYERVFGAAETDDIKMGAHLQRKIESFQWVQEHHLDLPFSFHHTLEVAQAELLRVNGFRAPRDKLIILQNTSQIVVDLIGKASASSAGTDHLLPVLILTILRANPPNLIANIKYIMRFRNQAELEKGNNQFCVTNMMSAVSFIYNMSPKSLTLNEEEGARYVSGGGASGSGSSKDPRSGDAGSSSSTGNKTEPVAPQVSQLASKVYTSTSGWFNTLIKEAKIFGEQAAGKVDGFVNQVVGDSDEDEQMQRMDSNNANKNNAGSNPYPGAIRTGQNNLAPGQQPAPWMMQPSPSISPLSPTDPLSAHTGGIPPPPPPRAGPGRHQGGVYPNNTHSQMSPTEQEDYELQLAMALSLSTIEADKQRRENEELQHAEGPLVALADDTAPEISRGESEKLPAQSSANSTLKPQPYKTDNVMEAPPVVVTDADEDRPLDALSTKDPVVDAPPLDTAEDVPLVKSQPKNTPLEDKPVLPNVPQPAGSDQSLI